MNLKYLLDIGMISFISYDFSSPYNKNHKYNYNVNELKEEKWMNDSLEYKLNKMVLQDNSKLKVKYVDVELIKYSLGILKEFEGSISVYTYKGIAKQRREEILFEIIKKAKELHKMTITYVEPELNLNILSNHINIIYLKFINYSYNGIKIVTEPKRKKENPLIIELEIIDNIDNIILTTIQNDLKELNKKYNRYNIYFR
jgi:hypothetical protein